MHHLESILSETEAAVAAIASDLSSPQSKLDKIQRSIAAALDELKDLRLEFDADSDVSELEKAADLEARFIDLRTAFRRAKLDLKQRQDEAAQNERNELLKGNTRQGDREKRKTMEKVEAAKLAGAELTETMKQASQMMAAEVERSIAAVQALESSTQMLDKTRSQYSVYESVLGLSSNVLKEIHRGSIMDKLVLYGGLGFFLLTVFYIIWKRTWIPGLSLIFPKKKAIVEAAKTIASTIASATTPMATTTAAAYHHHHHHHYDEL